MYVLYAPRTPTIAHVYASESQKLQFSGAFSDLDAHPGCRVVIQTSFSAFLHFTSLGRVSVCVSSESERWLSFSSTHPISDTIHPCSCFSFKREGDFFPSSISPLCRHASSRRRASGARLDTCLQTHFIFISCINSGVERRAHR